MLSTYLSISLLVLPLVITESFIHFLSVYFDYPRDVFGKNKGVLFSAVCD